MRKYDKSILSTYCPAVNQSYGLHRSRLMCQNSLKSRPKSSLVCQEVKESPSSYAELEPQITIIQMLWGKKLIKKINDLPHNRSNILRWQIMYSFSNYFSSCAETNEHLWNGGVANSLKIESLKLVFLCDLTTGG